tara:strand:- start:29475 stop:29648 length:174 start_codon:yes stop_codon:yes gene_type:complete
MIEIHKVVVQEKDNVKKIGIKYTQDDVPMPFVVMLYSALNDGQGDVVLKQAVLAYLS